MACQLNSDKASYSENDNFSELVNSFAGIFVLEDSKSGDKEKVKNMNSFSKDLISFNEEMDSDVEMSKSNFGLFYSFIYFFSFITGCIRILLGLSIHCLIQFHKVISGNWYREGIKVKEIGGNSIAKRSSTVKSSRYRSVSLPLKKQRGTVEYDLLRKIPLCKVDTNTNIKSTNRNSDNFCIASEAESYFAGQQKMDLRYFMQRFPRYANSYVQVIFNLSVAVLLLYSFSILLIAIKSDIESKIQLYSREIINDIGVCAKHYSENKCIPEYRVPALEKPCSEWERCMNQNPAIVARRSVLTAQTVGEIINTFLDQISWKSASLIVLGFLSLFVGSNLAFSIASTNFVGKSDNIYKMSNKF